MFGIGGQELFLILILALIILGPKKLPDIAKSLGRAMGEFQRATDGLKKEFDQATDLKSPPFPEKKKVEEPEPEEDEQEPDQKPEEEEQDKKPSEETSTYNPDEIEG